MIQRIKFALRILFGLPVNAEARKTLNELMLAWHAAQSASIDIHLDNVSADTYAKRDAAELKRDRAHTRLLMLLQRPWASLPQGDTLMSYAASDFGLKKG